MYNLTMTLTAYRRDLQAKKKELVGLLTQRQKIDQKMAQLQPIILHLEGLCKELGDRAAKESATKVELTTGLTKLARATLEEAYLPLSTSELKQRMEAKGFDFSNYSNPLASIHVVLQRLVKSGQVKAVPLKGGKKAYQWITTIANILALLNEVIGIAAQAQPKRIQVQPGPNKEIAERLGAAPPKR